MNNIIDIKNGFIVFNNSKVDIIIDNNKILWLNAKELCKVLKYKNPKDAIIRLVDKIDKIKLENIRNKYKIDKHPHSIYINESGLYSLLLSCRLNICKDFRTWITRDVIPSIRKYGYYELKKKYDGKIKNVQNMLNDIQKEYEKIKNNLKKEKYPKGGLFYVIKTNKDKILKIGISEKMNNRTGTYNTSIVDNVNVLYYIKVDCPTQLELCVKSLLYKYRYRNNREFYECTLDKIKDTVKKCLKVMNDNNIGKNKCKSIPCTQVGGYINNNNMINYLINKYINYKKYCNYKIDSYRLKYINELAI